MSGNTPEVDAAPRDPEMVSAVAAVALGIVTAGLYPVWAFLPRLARHARLTGVVPLADEVLDVPPRSAGPTTQESLAPWLFTIAWLLLAMLMALGFVMVTSQRGGGWFGNAMAITRRRYIVMSYYMVEISILGLFAFPAAVQIYARWYLGTIQRREVKALGDVAEKLGGSPPKIANSDLEIRVGAYALVIAAIAVPALVFGISAGGFEGVGILFVMMAFVVLFLWAVTLGPATTAALFNRHLRECRAAQAWLRERPARDVTDVEAGGPNNNA
jgi:hypothetical protein